MQFEGTMSYRNYEEPKLAALTPPPVTKQRTIENALDENRAMADEICLAIKALTDKLHPVLLPEYELNPIPERVEGRSPNNSSIVQQVIDDRTSQLINILNSINMLSLRVNL